MLLIDVLEKVSATPAIWIWAFMALKVSRRGTSPYFSLVEKPRALRRRRLAKRREAMFQREALTHPRTSKVAFMTSPKVISEQFNVFRTVKPRSAMQRHPPRDWHESAQHARGPWFKHHAQAVAEARSSLQLRVCMWLRGQHRRMMQPVAPVLRCWHSCLAVFAGDQREEIPSKAGLSRALAIKLSIVTCG